MTVSEAIKILKRDLQIQKDNKALPDGIESLEIAIKSLEELERYRAIGTVEDIQSMKDNGAFSGVELAQIACMQIKLKEYQSIGTIEEFKALKGKETEILLKDGQFLYQQGLVDGYAKAIEEFKELKEKNTPMELAEHNFQDEVHHYLCPSCRNIVSCNQNYCEECGQALET